jgi:hypothetical protein
LSTVPASAGTLIATRSGLPLWAAARSGTSEAGVVDATKDH